MVLKFKCQNCGEDIIVKLVKVGEIAQCKHCKARVEVPETAVRIPDRKLVQQIRENMRSKSTEELLRIWEENDREQYSEEAFEAIKQLITERGVALPAQKKTVKEVREEDITKEIITKSIKTSTKVLVAWGAINVALWFLWGAEDRSVILSRFSEINIWLWIILYGGLVIGITLLLFGLIGLVVRRPIIVLLGAICLLLIGVWNIGGDFLSIPALNRYGYSIDVSDIVKEINIIWIVIGIMQLYWGFRDIDIYVKIRSKSTQTNSTQRQDNNIPTQRKKPK